MRWLKLIYYAPPRDFFPEETLDAANVNLPALYRPGADLEARMIFTDPAGLQFQVLDNVEYMIRNIFIVILYRLRPGEEALRIGMWSHPTDLWLSRSGEDLLLRYLDRDRQATDLRLPYAECCGEITDFILRHMQRLKAWEHPRYDLNLQLLQSQGYTSLLP